MPRILIIDDDVALADMMARRLSMAGFQVTTASDGEAGLAAAAVEKPDLILGDVALPGINGFEVLDRLRSRSDWNGTPFLFLTAATQDQDLRRGMNLGADDYLCKPVAWVDLIAAISVRLERHRKDQERAHRLQEGAIEVLTGFAHDIRGPLFALGASADLLRQSEPSPVGDDEKAHLLDVMKGMVARLHGMSDDLLTYSKSRLGAEPLSCAWVGASVLTTRARGESSAPDRIDLRLPAEPFPVWCDEVLVRQAVRNLLENALKFTPPTARKIWLGCEETEEGVEFWVDDLGKGIPPADLPYIFEPFWKGRSARNNHGSGFGLAISHSHVRRHGGTIEVASIEGKGSRFTIRLPNRRAANAAPHGRSTPAKLL